MSKTLFAENLDQLNSVSEQIIEHTSPHKNFAFYGDIGVGKTALIKALSLHLGVTDDVSSKYIFARENMYFVYQNNYNQFVQFYKNTYQHGGISMEEMLIPVITLRPK